MAESVIIDRNELPLLKAVEYRASLSIASTARSAIINATSFLDKDGNSYSPTLPGGYNVIGFCHLSSGSQYCPVTQMNLLGSTSSDNMFRVLDVRATSSTGSYTARIVALYLRAPVAVEEVTS